MQFPRRECRGQSPRQTLPQSFNRYSYVNNRPIVAVDPTGHDLMIVGGYKGDFDLVSWKDWIIAYKGWSEAEFKAAYSIWTAALGADGQNLKAGNEALSGFGIRMFTWGADTWDGAKENAASAGYSAMVPELSKAMAGMQDVTLLGLSKGGELALEYLSALSSGAQLTAPTHVGLLSPASSVAAWAYSSKRWGWGGAPYLAAPNNPGTDVANVCAGDDPSCTYQLMGAMSFHSRFSVGPWEMGPISGHGIHGELAKQVLDALNVEYDHGAWGYRNAGATGGGR